METNHTPTPWKVDEDGNFIGPNGEKITDDEPTPDNLNIKFLIEAVNSHDALEARVRELEKASEKIISEAPTGESVIRVDYHALYWRVFKEVKEILAKPSEPVIQNDSLGGKEKKTFIAPCGHTEIDKCDCDIHGA